MNIINNSERRTRVKKPMALVVISFILILSPIYNYYLQLYLRKLDVSWVNILSLSLTKMELLFIFLPVVCGVGLFLIKKWAWYLFLIYSSILILFNIIVTTLHPIRFNFYSLFESTLIFLGVVYFLKKDISAPYFKMYPRGWRGEKRKPVQIQVRINSEDRLTKDISEAGFYIEWKDAPFEINEEVTVEMVRLRSPTESAESSEAESDKRLFAAGVVRKEDNGVGFAFRQMSEEDSRWIMNKINS